MFSLAESQNANSQMPNPQWAYSKYHQCKDVQKHSYLKENKTTLSLKTTQRRKKEETAKNCKITMNLHSSLSAIPRCYTAMLTKPLQIGELLIKQYTKASSSINNTSIDLVNIIRLMNAPLT